MIWLQKIECSKWDNLAHTVDAVRVHAVPDGDPRAGGDIGRQPDGARFAQRALNAIEQRLR